MTPHGRPVFAQRAQVGAGAAYRKRMALAPGLTASVTLVVDEADTALAFGSGDVPVLGTPRLIALAEQASIEAIAGEARPRRDARRSVTKCSSPTSRPHQWAERSTAEATLEQIEGRRLTFRVCGQRRPGLVAAGRITRVVVERARFIERGPNRGDDLRRVRTAGRAGRRLRTPSPSTGPTSATRSRSSSATDQRRARRARRPTPTIKAVIVTGVGPGVQRGLRPLRVRAAPPTTPSSGVGSGRRATATTTTVLHFPAPDARRRQRAGAGGRVRPRVLCDLRIAASTARFAHPERTFGDVVYGPLHDLVGGAVARELTLGGRELTRHRSARRPPRRRGRRTPRALVAATERPSTRMSPPRQRVLMRTKAKALRRAGFAHGTPTLDL